MPESTPPLPKDVKDMIDRRIEIINNKEELVSVLNRAVSGCSVITVLSKVGKPVTL